MLLDLLLQTYALTIKGCLVLNMGQGVINELGHMGDLTLVITNIVGQADCLHLD